MKYRATASFIGVVCMNKGEIRELPDSPLVYELTESGYIEEVKDKKKKKPKGD